MAALAELESVGRLVDGLRIAMAGEVAARSDAAYGDEGLSRSQNFATPAKFLAAVTGVSVSTAASRVRLAAQVHTTFSVTGLPNPPRFPRVADALATGAIGVDAAAAITKRLHDVATRTGFTEALEEAEGELVSLAQQTIGGLGYTADDVDALALRAREHLDPDGAEPREADLHDRRYLTLSPHRSGMTKLTGCLPPSSAAILKAALEPFTSPRVVAFTDPTPPAGDPTPPAGDPTPPPGDSAPTSGDPTLSPGSPAASPGDSASSRAATTTGHLTAPDFATAPDPDTAPDPVFEDTRTRGQKTADALVQLVAMAAGLPALPRINGAAPTVNVHAALDDIVAGRGVGWVDGLTEPVPHTTIETLLCHADTITTLFGQHGQILQHGKTKRLFTAAQNRALAARDGGCIWPGCDAPPSWCESHHVDGWLSDIHPGGVTDIDNGALLCHFHHSHVHKSRWILSMRNGAPHLTPPDTIDWTQT
ncbi:hypothetical protein C5B96_00480, partial [Subtercola sp. Z020]